MTSPCYKQPKWSPWPNNCQLVHAHIRDSWSFWLDYKKQDQQEFVFVLCRRKLYNETDASMNEWKLRKGMLLTQAVVSLGPHIMNETMTGHFVNSTMCAMSSGWRGEVLMYLDKIHLWEQFVHLLSLALSERNNSKEMWELSVCCSKKCVTGISTSQCLQWNDWHFEGPAERLSGISQFQVKVYVDQNVSELFFACRAWWQ